MTPVTRRRRWLDLLVAAFLVVLVPVCWSWALVEDDIVSASSDRNAEDETGEDGAPFELQGAARGHAHARAPAPPPATTATAPKQRPVTPRASTLLASAAPKPDPLRLSVRRQH